MIFRNKGIQFLKQSVSLYMNRLPSQEFMNHHLQVHKNSGKDWFYFVLTGPCKNNTS